MGLGICDRYFQVHAVCPPPRGLLTCRTHMPPTSSVSATAPAELAPVAEPRTAFLSDFHPRFARLVASWIRSDRELLWLAPGTAPPISERKVLDWGLERRRRHLLWLEGDAAPAAYAELNEMPNRTDQFWIGHFIVDPARRAAGLGTILAQALITRGFVELGASDVLLVVFPENAGAIRCYERAGMVVLGKERKHFETTGHEHAFLRMGIHRTRFRRLASAGRLPTRPLAYVEHVA